MKINLMNIGALVCLCVFFILCICPVDAGVSDRSSAGSSGHSIYSGQQWSSGDSDTTFTLRHARAQPTDALRVCCGPYGGLLSSDRIILKISFLNLLSSISHVGKLCHCFLSHLDVRSLGRIGTFSIAVL